MKLSEKVELVLNFLEQCKSDHTWYTKQLEVEQKKENTLRHELEGVGITHRTPPGYKDRARLATDYQTVLIARRIAKDHVMLNEPIVQFLDSEVGKSAVKQLRQRLGEMRKVESRMIDRKFYTRRAENTAPVNEDLKRNLDRMIQEWKKRK